MKWLGLISVLLVATFVLAYTFQDHVIHTTESNAQPEVAALLSVSPQIPRTDVTIRHVRMLSGGFVVVRGSDGTRLGQVIEVSGYLKPGEYSDVRVPLGDFYSFSDADQLIVMIYEDDGDGAFSELDQPTVQPHAVFVETGELVPNAVLKSEVAGLDGMAMATVRYTDAGFTPTDLNIPKGTMVEFINQSNIQMWVASNEHPAHELLPTFDQFKGVGKGETYMYTFDKAGTWAYHDHINPEREGNITVE